MTADREPMPALRLSAALYRFRESLFLLPATIVVLGAALAEATAAVDRALGDDVPFTLDMTSDAASATLSTLAGATITTAGVVFSLTVVSLQLASSQFSPRVMRSFIRDRLSQVVIGLLVATFVFCVLTLRHLGAPEQPAPTVSLTVAVALTLVTVLLIVAHLDHLARGLQVGEVVRSISDEGAEVVAAQARATRDEQAAEVPATPEDGFVVPALRDGWVTQVPSRRMLDAVPPGTTIRLETRPGAYIHEGEPLATLWPRPQEPRRVLARLSRTVAVSRTRTMQEDVDFAIRQLVDVALRALSPAVNDPTTAVEVTLRLGSLLRRLLAAEAPPAAVAGAEGRVLLRPWALTPDEYVAHAFDQLRHAGPSPQVTAAQLRVLRMLIVHVQEVGRPEHVGHLRRQLDLVLESVRDDPDLQSADRERLLAIGAAQTDPADHGRRAPGEPGGS